ncbi:hypothetical protein [Lentzea sp. NPDC003310]|uniref:hypothetical protein n=1 Tax=Lentzea sp. NPDC003310 TaxID=3154447 RepID=UPI0033B384C1
MFTSHGRPCDHRVPADRTQHDRVGDQEVRIASGLLVPVSRTPSTTQPGAFKDAGILLTSAAERWQYGNVIEAFADTLERHGIEVTELEAL